MKRRNFVLGLFASIAGLSAKREKGVHSDDFEGLKAVQPERGGIEGIPEFAHGGLIAEKDIVMCDLGAPIMSRPMRTEYPCEYVKAPDRGALVCGVDKDGNTMAVHVSDNGELSLFNK